MPQPLGQHFLHDKQTLHRVALALDVQKNDTVIEIGPGHGELTREILTIQSQIRLIAIEKDPILAETLKKTEPLVETIAGDALKILEKTVENITKKVDSYKIIGNIPYYITGKLLRTVGELSPLPERIVLTTQKEVAERVVGTPPHMNLLAASVQVWANAEILEHIPKSRFSPAPKVDSALLLLIPHGKTLEDTERYYRLIKKLFRQPRKTVLNNLLAKEDGLANAKKNNKEDVLRALSLCGISPTDRPQNIPIESIKKLALILYN